MKKRKKHYNKRHYDEKNVLTEYENLVLAFAMNNDISYEEAEQHPKVKEFFKKNPHLLIEEKGVQL